MTRFGLVGFGAIGRMRARAMRQTPGADLRMIAEPIDERRAQAAAEYGIPVVASVEELVANQEIDAVIVSTPPNLHRSHCESAFRAGKHVLCEKPLASTIDDCRRIAEFARKCGRILGVGFNYRFYPAVTKARELVAAKRIGEVVSVAAFAGHPGGPEFTHQWVHDPAIMGGGALMDNGIHAADLLLHFLGEVAETHGFTSDHVWQFRGSEDNGYVLARTASGRIGTLHASWTEWRGYHFHVDICGTLGLIRLWYPPMLTVIYERPSESAKRGRRSIFLFPMMQVKERLRSYRWTLVESLAAEQCDFVKRIHGGAGVGATGVDGLAAVELVSSAYARGHGALAGTASSPGTR